MRVHVAVPKRTHFQPSSTHIRLTEPRSNPNSLKPDPRRSSADTIYPSSTLVHAPVQTRLKWSQNLTSDIVIVKNARLKATDNIRECLLCVCDYVNPKRSEVLNQCIE